MKPSFLDEAIEILVKTLCMVWLMGMLLTFFFILVPGCNPENDTSTSQVIRVERTA